jgi:hypothetical protein
MRGKFTALNAYTRNEERSHISNKMWLGLVWLMEHEEAMRFIASPSSNQPNYLVQSTGKTVLNVLCGASDGLLFVSTCRHPFKEAQKYSGALYEWLLKPGTISWLNHTQQHR